MYARLDCDKLPLLDCSKQAQHHEDNILCQGHGNNGDPPSSRIGMFTRSKRWLWSRGLACALVSSLVFSFATVCVKFTSGRIPVAELALIRCSVSVGLALLLSWHAGTPRKLVFGERYHWLLLAGRGLFGSTAMLTGYVALYNLPIADAVVLGQTNPPVTALVAWIILREPLGIKGCLGCLLSFGGVVILTHPPWLFGGHDHWDSARLLGTVMGILSAALAAGAYICIRKIGSSEPALVVTLWFHAVAVILTCGPVAAGYPQHAVPPGPLDWGLILAMTVMAFMALVIMTRGFQLLSASKASAVGFTGVVYSYIYGTAFFGEKITLLGLLGTALVLAGVLLVTARNSPGTPPLAQPNQTSSDSTVHVVVCQDMPGCRSQHQHIDRSVCKTRGVRPFLDDDDDSQMAVVECLIHSPGFGGVKKSKAVGSPAQYESPLQEGGVLTGPGSSIPTARSEHFVSNQPGWQRLGLEPPGSVRAPVSGDPASGIMDQSDGQPPPPRHSYAQSLLPAGLFAAMSSRKQYMVRSASAAAAYRNISRADSSPAQLPPHAVSCSGVPSSTLPGRLDSVDAAWQGEHQPRSSYTQCPFLSSLVSPGDASAIHPHYMH